MSLRRTQSSRPFLSLQEATFRLGDRLLFENTSWVFQRGEHWAILGHNGSGKSLFADALRGKVPLVGGKLRYHFRPRAGLSPEEAIGHVCFEDRKHEVHGTVAQSRWNSLEEESTLRVREFLAYERVMDVNPFEVGGGHEQKRRPFERRRHRAVGLSASNPSLSAVCSRCRTAKLNGCNWRARCAIPCACSFWTSRSWAWIRMRENTFKEFWSG